MKHDTVIRLRNAKPTPRYRCTTCEGRRRVWKAEKGDFVPYPHCTSPEPARRAA
jgi:hypothetical protein